MTWIRCADRMPTEEDADKDGNVAVIGFSENYPWMRKRPWAAIIEWRRLARAFDPASTLWMRLPDPPEEE